MTRGIPPKRPFWRLRPFLISTALAVAFVLFAQGAARAADDDKRIIGEVTVSGNHFVKKRTILGKVKSRAGDVIVDPTFRADTDRLLETKSYDDVQVALEDMTVTDAQGHPKVRVIFQVVERPTIRRVDFKGNVKLPASKFRDAISSKPDESFDRFNAAQDVQKILSTYHEEGYADAEAEYYTSTHPKTKKVILTFFIKEGNRVLVQSVNVTGNRVFSDSKIKGLMKKTRHKKVFKEETLSEDLEVVKRAYQNHGYLEVDIAVTERRYDEDHTKVDLTIDVKEGRLYTVGNFSFSGATLFKEKDLQKAVALKSGHLYRQDKMDETQQNLQEMYADKGYLRAEILPHNVTQPVGEENGTLDVHFEITESSVVYVDRIYIDFMGEDHTTKDYVVRREIDLKEGDVFSSKKVRRSVEKLYNLGFLDDVQVDVQQPRSPDEADLVFNVKEGKPGILSAGAGYSSTDQLIGTLQVQHTNLLGRAQRLNLMWEFGARKQNYEIGWTEPWFLGKRMSFGVDLFDTVRVRPFGSDSTAYKEGRRGFSLRLGPRITDQFSLIHNFTYEDVRVFDIDALHTNNPNTGDNITPSNDRTSSLTNGFVLDTRDNVFDATRGSRHSATLQFAGGPIGGNVNFYKPEASATYYFPTFWKFIFTLAARGGYVQEYGKSQDVPLSERFVMGGVDTVRGYDYGQIGPKNYGKIMMVYNAEYKFPIVQEKNRTILQGAFFADVGGAWENMDDVTFSIGSKTKPGDKDYTVQMRSGVGFGIRFKTPVFPIRLDWGYGLNHRAGEGLSQFYFTIGNIF